MQLVIFFCSVCNLNNDTNMNCKAFNGYHHLYLLIYI